MGAIKHALIIGEELAEMIIEHLDGEGEAVGSLALETAIRCVMPDAAQRTHFAKGILASAEWEQQFDAVHNVEQEGDDDHQPG